MIRLSVNVNKIATVRNSRGGPVPSVLDAVRVCVEAGAPGITVHPRADARHITRRDVLDIADFLRDYRRRGPAGPAGPPTVEYNIEGDPRPDLLALVHDVKPIQCTLVPVKPGEITSQAGWPAGTPVPELEGVIRQLRGAGVRVSLFVDPEPRAVAWAHALGADRIELYTEPFARAFARDEAEGRRVFERYLEAAAAAHGAALGINAGHDLDLDNLTLFRTLPHLAEVSIGHALISRALWVGLERTVRDYLQVLAI